ncbi:MAG: hypothetical protein CSYNP_01857 [Syntrophus sp. SKADARSKE-3]|nr:hypothetical protein [Syntrophus sp. SKADARSKE-3]
MNDVENDQLFSSVIKINYDKRFIGIAQGFIEKLSVLAGANDKECLQLSLLIEECLVFIIDKYIDCRAAAHVEICFKVTADKKACIEITDIGPPIHESMIPSFDIMNEDSEAGLWYKVIRELSDKFVFINQFRAGWLIQIEKNIESITFGTDRHDGKEKNPLVKHGESPGENHIRPATVDDIPGLIDLAYMTYRYSYDLDYYNRDLLKKTIEEKLCDIMLIEHGHRIIGACTIKYADANRISAEVGSTMIAPDYRGTEAASLMLQEVNAYVRSNPHHCEFFMTTAVTGHLRSQKYLPRIHNGFKPLMICLNMIARPVEFMGIDYKTRNGESLLFAYHLNHHLKMRKLYITTETHLQIINELIAYTGNNIEVLNEFSEPENPVSQISVQRIDSHKFALVSIESIGLDWFASLIKIIFAEIVSGVESVRVTIPTSSPLPSDMERMLTDLNLVFCGLSLRSMEKIDLAYCLTTKPVDFSLIKIYDPVAQKLLTHIEKIIVGIK